MNRLLSLTECLTAACLLEATARKPGNVHPEASFADLSYRDFVESAKAAAPLLARASEIGVGRTIYEAVAATRKVAPSNTNLGMILLLAPLAAVPQNVPLTAGIPEVLRRLTIEDAVWAYRGIRLASPGGMGQQSEQDVEQEPTITLRDAMQLAADRDSVAAQYVTDFALVLQAGAPLLGRFSNFATDWEHAVIRLQLHLMSDCSDTLIARKCGTATAIEAGQRASAVLLAGWPDQPDSAQALQELDAWLRGDKHRRNPGTTADLVAASLFAALRDHSLPCPAWVNELADGEASA